MNSKLERSLKGEIELHVTDKETWDRLMQLYESKGIKCGGTGDTPTNFKWKESTKWYCVGIYDGNEVWILWLQSRDLPRPIEELYKEDWEVSV